MLSEQRQFSLALILQERDEHPCHKIYPLIWCFEDGGGEHVSPKISQRRSVWVIFTLLKSPPPAQSLSGGCASGGKVVIEQFTCQSVLGQDTELQSAPSTAV